MNSPREEATRKIQHFLHTCPASTLFHLIDDQWLDREVHFPIREKTAWVDRLCQALGYAVEPLNSDGQFSTLTELQAALGAATEYLLVAPDIHLLRALLADLCLAPGETNDPLTEGILGALLTLADFRVVCQEALSMVHTGKRFPQRRPLTPEQARLQKAADELVEQTAHEVRIALQQLASTPLPALEADGSPSSRKDPPSPRRPTGETTPVDGEKKKRASAGGGHHFHAWRNLAGKRRGGRRFS